MDTESGGESSGERLEAPDNWPDCPRGKLAAVESFPFIDDIVSTQGGPIGRPIPPFDMHQRDACRAKHGIPPLEYEQGNEGKYVIAKLLYDAQAVMMEK